MLHRRTTPYSLRPPLQAGLTESVPPDAPSRVCLPAAGTGRPQASSPENTTRFPVSPQADRHPIGFPPTGEFAVLTVPTPRLQTGARGPRRIRPWGDNRRRFLERNPTAKLSHGSSQAPTSSTLQSLSSLWHATSTPTTSRDSRPSKPARPSASPVPPTRTNSTPPAVTPSSPAATASTTPTPNTPSNQHAI